MYNSLTQQSFLKKESGGIIFIYYIHVTKLQIVDWKWSSFVIFVFLVDLGEILIGIDRYHLTWQWTSSRRIQQSVLLVFAL